MSSAHTGSHSGSLDAVFDMASVSSPLRIYTTSLPGPWPELETGKCLTLLCTLSQHAKSPFHLCHCGAWTLPELSTRSHKGTPFGSGRETAPPPCRPQWPSVLTEMSGQERHQVRPPKASRALTWSSTIFKHACSSEHFTSDQLLEHWNSCFHWFLPKLIVDLGRKNFPVSSFGHSCKFYPALSFK